MRHSRLFAAIALLLLTVSSLVPVSPAQSAGAPALCFDKDPRPPNMAFSPDDPLPEQTGQTTNRQCPGGFPVAPDYYEGAAPRIRLENFDSTTSQPWIRAICATQCHEQADTVESPHRYYARWTGQTLEFPRDFREAGPNGDGRSASGDHGLRYNSTWTFTALIGGAPVSRTLNVWTTSIFRSQNLTLQPGAEHEVHYAGVETTATLEWKFERLNENLTWIPMNIGTSPPPAQPNLGGEGFFVWKIPKDEAVRIQKCPPGHERDCYRLSIRAIGSTKDPEEFYFGGEIARLQPTFKMGQFSNPNHGSQSEGIQRTQNVTVAVHYNYPGGRLYQGAYLTPADLGPTANSQPPTLRMRVEKTTLSSQTPVQVAEVQLSFVQGRNWWQGTWTVARDLASDPDATYRLKIVETPDRWGNKVPTTGAGNYTVSAAKLEPVITTNVTRLERTQEGVLGVTIRYHNGSLFTDAENATQLRGCFVRESSNGFTPACPQPNQQPTVGEYKDGEWRFKVRYPFDYSGLGAHRFVLLGNNEARDKWNNTVNGTMSAVYDVVAASPRIDFSTTMRGRTVTELERGEHIGVVVRTTYPDGSPLNHTVRDENDPEADWAKLLNVTVTKRGENDAIQDAFVLQLTEVDVSQGLWVGSFDLSLDASRTPAGRWTFATRVNDSLDVQNVNETIFERIVIPAPIQYQQVRLSPSQPFSGANILYEFRLSYPGQFGASGPEVPPEAIRSQMTAQVFRWDAKNRTAYGDPLSSYLQPEYAADRHVWSLRYTVPGNLFSGSYVFVLDGADSSGNTLPGDAWSTPFQPQSRLEDRQILTQPAVTVQRGESATVVFAAEDGDTGPDGSGAPQIIVERWNPDAQRWDAVAGGQSARVASPDIVDHFGVFGVTTTTAIGTYRFVLSLREASPSYALIQAYSTNFTVLPTDITRAIIVPLPEFATKGDLVYFTIERVDGDRVTKVELYHNGRLISIAKPQLVVEGDHLNGTWRIPFDAPNGNYTLHIEGRDQFGNTIVVDTPAIEALSAQLSGKLLGNPAKVVKRGDVAQILFGITYPTGAFYSAKDAPSVLVFNDSGLVSTAEVNRTGATFTATWAPQPAAGVGEYWFEINGQGAGGNSFPNLRSNTFRLAPGTFTRAPANDIPVGTERITTNTWAIPIDPNDRSVSFLLGYYGNTLDTQSVEGKDPLTLTPLPHSIDQVAGRYVARFVSDQATPVGAYRISMKGEDRLGNQLASQSNVFLVRPTSIIVTWDQQPKQAEFVEGAILRLTFNARYKVGPIMDDTMGRPSVALLLDNQPTTQRPEVDFGNGQWRVTWVAPQLKDGTYTFVAGGQDISGNSIINARSLQYKIETPLASSFAKVIPGAELPLMVLGIAALALVLGRARRAK